jgi:hypothetical protein
MRLLRAPIVAFALLGVVVVGALVDGADAPERPTLAGADDDGETTTTITATTLVLPPASTTVVLPPTTTTTVDPFVEGDDDPEAIDNRTWTWDQLADCESGAWGADRVPIPGTARWDVTRAIYQGGLQFAAGTWDAYKEPGYPEDAHHATREQQIVVAEKVIQRQGPRAWPTCAPRLGMVGTDLPLDAPVEPSVPLAEALP